MKKTIAVVCCLVWTAAFAQNFPAESLNTYRDNAYQLFMAGDTAKAVDLYKQLVQSGDALSGYYLYEIYTKGEGAWKDPDEAERWRSLAQKLLSDKMANPRPRQGERNLNDSPQLLEDLLNESGTLIEQGAREKNIAIALCLIGGAAGGTLTSIGLYNQSTTVTVFGGVVIGGFGIAALVMDILGNKHIKQGGELMRRVKIKGNGISVSF